MEVKKFVPWFSMQEWKKLREMIYSSESADFAKGYETLQVWKARCPILPVGVECTMEVLRVMLEDKMVHSVAEAEGSVSVVALSSLELVYSSAIMRFLNFVTEIKSAEVSTIYKAANELNIPDWIVNIRHDAAHGRNVPSLPLLRSAVKFIFDWLYENYWQDEPEATQGYSVPEEGEISWKEKLSNLIHHWVSVSLLCQTGVSTLDEMRVSPEGKTLYQKLYEDGMLKSFQVASADFISLIDIRQKLLRKIQRIVQQRSSKSDNDSALTLILTTGASNMLSWGSNSTNWVVPKEWFELWWEVIQHLSSNAFFSLLGALRVVSNGSEGNLRAKMAALWLAEFFRVIKGNLKNMYDSDREIPSLPQLPDKDKLQMFVKDACLHPNQMTSVYLSRLLDLLEPRLDRKKKKMMIELHQIYAGRKVEDGNETELENNGVIHSLESLLLDGPSVEERKEEEKEKEKEKEKEEEEEEEEEVSTPVNRFLASSTGIWKLSQGDFGWSACPLGVVPWQRQHTLPNWSALV